jgi:hypothetical protein
MNDCLHGTGKVKKILCVSSYDPNEMIGPSGFGDEHYIKPAPEMSYTVTFENKSTATAPAHEVFVTDTLDKSRYDLESFGFTSFGWADTTIRVEGQNMKEFTQDVKLEAKNMIVRVNGKLDTEKGVASWSFITLDQKGNVEEDPDKGFLVPNNSNHEGEGFVTFAINHLDGLANGAGYGIILIVVAIFRELFGSGTLLGIQIIPEAFYNAGYMNNGLVILPPMALILIGCIIWVHRSVDKELQEK